MKLNTKITLSIVIGSILGFSYYYFIGCENGCAIQSDWRLSTLYGAFAGFALAMPVKKDPNKEKRPE